MDIRLFKELMKEAVVFDGRNIFDPNIMRTEDIEYYSIGRK